MIATWVQHVLELVTHLAQFHGQLLPRLSQTTHGHVIETHNHCVEGIQVLILFATEVHKVNCYALITKQSRNPSNQALLTAIDQIEID